MQYRLLGRTGMEVSVLCLGTMMFGKMGNSDHADCIRTIHAALDGGINFVDTADMYSAGESETIIGKALRSRRDKVILATKGHFQMGEGRNRSGNSRRWLTMAVDDSLKRLGTDWIDLYQIHRPDPNTDVEETLFALTDLVRAGKIRAFGCSYTPAEEMIDAAHVAERRGLMKFRTEQPSYSMMTRGIEAAVLPTCERLGLGVLVSSSLAWGFLTGRYRAGKPVDMAQGRAAILPERFDPLHPGNAAKFTALEAFIELAHECGMSLPQLAISFTSAHRAVTATIIGPRTLVQLEDLLRASGGLTDEMLDRIDTIVPPGTNLYDPDRATRPALLDPRRRRRDLVDRAIG